MNTESRASAAVEPSSAPDQTFQPWHFFVLASLAAATAAVILSRQTTPEHLILISLTIAAAGLAAAGFHRMLAPLASGELPVDKGAALSTRTREALEREKMLTLRAIKELEFDHAMGKIAKADFDELSGRLRGRAIAIMRQLDEDRSGYRSIIERELETRLHARGAEAPAAPAAANKCASCATLNDPDAAFCKRCGVRLGQSSDGAS